MLNDLYAPKKMLLLASAAMLLACGPAIGVVLAHMWALTTIR